MYRRLIKMIALAGAAALVISCAAPTTIESSWRDPTFAGNGFEKLAVLALFETKADSREFEADAVASLRQAGINAVPSHSFLEPGEMLSHEEMEQKLLGVDADGILIFKLIAVDKEQVYRPPTRYRIHPGFVRLDPFYGYYYPHPFYHSYWYSGLQVTSQNGYWREREYYVIESALYDNATDQLVWTAKSETRSPDSIEELSRSVIDSVQSRLFEMNLIESRGQDRYAALAGNR